MSTLIDHFETLLGPIISGWSRDAEGNKLPIQVALFEKSPIQGARVLATLGLSHVPLRVRDTSRSLRQELIVMFRESDGHRNLPSVLHQLALEALSKDRAYLLGDVLGPRGELRDGSAMEAFYVAVPVYLPDSFQVFQSSGEAIVIAWLVPITASEAAFVRAHGRDVFEKLLESADPDLLDFGRPAIV